MPRPARKGKATAAAKKDEPISKKAKKDVPVEEEEKVEDVAEEAPAENGNEEANGGSDADADQVKEGDAADAEKTDEKKEEPKKEEEKKTEQAGKRGRGRPKKNK